MSAGIDYGMGTTNIDTQTGIRFGVIPVHDVCQSWSDSSEPEYGAPHCPKCGNEATEYANDSHGECVYVHENVLFPCPEYACENCKVYMESGDVFGDEPIAWILDDGEYLAEQSGDDCDIFVLKSPYYTRAQFCSPCAPGAAYLRNPCDDGPKAYCFDPEWFDDDNPCPYPVYRVSDDALVYNPAIDVE